ncbi:MFS transporter [Saccharolobus sp.]|uniref:MFS transporter n=1 Tax=Saccharolobus sp. TaxID=2100761 RepID=UPI00316BC445
MSKQFLLFTILVFFTGLYLGTLRIVIPVFQAQINIGPSLALLLPLVSFGFVKGFFNYIAGKLSDDLGRKRILIIGWIVALVSITLFLNVNIVTIVALSILLAINQAFTWTTTVTSQIDIGGKSRAGLATGINEMSGYLGVAVGSIMASNFLKWSYLLELSISAIALICSIYALETKRLIKNDPQIKVRYVSITRISIAGLLEKFVDSSYFILIPTYLLLNRYSLVEIGFVVSIYAFTWSLSQPLFGYLADNGKRKLILSLGFSLMFSGFLRFQISPLLFSIVEGLGMGMVYPNLIAAVNDKVEESVRGKALGYYRLYRDSGYGVAGLMLPVLFSSLGFNETLLIVGLFQLLGLLMMLRGY